MPYLQASITKSGDGADFYSPVVKLPEIKMANFGFGVSVSLTGSAFGDFGVTVPIAITPGKKYTAFFSVYAFPTAVPNVGGDMSCQLFFGGTAINTVSGLSVSGTNSRGFLNFAGTFIAQPLYTSVTVRPASLAVDAGTVVTYQLNSFSVIEWE